MRLLVVLLMFVPGAGLAQQVYKCDGPSGSVYQNAPCEPDSKPHETNKDSNFGGSSKSAEVGVAGEACVADSAATYANGFLVNRTADPKQVKVTANFTRQGRLVDTIALSYDVAPFGRTPFSLIGSYGTSCSLAWEWD